MRPTYHGVARCSLLVALCSCPIFTACGDPAPVAKIKRNDHQVCVEGDTDVPAQEEPQEPFGDTGAIEGTGAVDETGSMEQGEAGPSYIGPAAGSARVEDGLFDDAFRSTVMCKPSAFTGRDDIWNQPKVGALTYCFGAFEDLDLEAVIRDAVADATWEYELVADVNFVHVSEFDGASCDQDADVVFVVNEGLDPHDCGPIGCPVAQAFFPSQADAGNAQRVFFFPTVIEESSFSTNGVVRHEFGHVLGLYHEQARYDQQDGVLSAVQEIKCALASGLTDQWRGVTPPDPDSIMGYPYCRGTPGGSETLSHLDKLGLRYLYNLPALNKRSLNNDEVDDVFWYGLSSGHLEVWYGVQLDDQIDFVEEGFCWDAAPYPACPTPAPEGLKPIPIGTTVSTDVLMYGPGQIPDRLFLMPMGPEGPDRFGVAIGLETAVPRVGDLAPGDDIEDVLFVLPGAGNGDWGLAGGTSSFQDYDFIEGVEGYFDAAVGLFVDREGAIGDQILWYSERSSAWHLTFRTAAGIQEEAVNPVECGLSGSSALNAIVGNFDSDPYLEILWYDYGLSSAILWTDIDDCANARMEYLINGRPKPHAGDFDGDGHIDVAWERPGPDDEIWRFTNVSNPIILAMVFPDDSVPAVGDFNGDGCSDILWHTSQYSTSPLWRSLCDGTFESTIVDSPQGAAATGYTYAHGRAYR